MHRIAILSALAAAAILFVPAGAQAQARSIAPPIAKALASNPGVPLAGRPNGDVIVTEYMDYNCPFCRRLAPELQKLVKADPKVRVLYKDWPIFGGVSVYAARVALAAAWQGKYLQVHDALIGSQGRLSSETQVRDVAKHSGLDLTRLDKDLKAHGAQIDALLMRNNREAGSLGLEGTPGLVVGSQLVFGGMSEMQMEMLAAQARRPR